MEKARVSTNGAETSHILGVDFGAAKIGLALSDTETKIAFAYTTLKNDKDFLPNLVAIIKEKNVRTVIIGFAKLKNQKDEGNKTEYKKVGDNLRKNIADLKIFFVDEMFTTKMAQDNLIEKGMKDIKRFDDQEAARIILQSYLDQIS